MSSIIGYSGGTTPPPPSTPPPPPPSSSGGSGKIAILFGAVVALLAACGYLFYSQYQMRTEMRAEIADMRDSLMSELAKERETSVVTTQTNRKSVETLKKDVDEARRQANLLAGQAKVEATKHADDLADKLEKMQEQQAARVTAVTADLTQVKDQATSTQGKVGEVSNDVNSLKTQQASTQSELEKTIAELKRTNGDLGVQSGLIATNGKELAALKALGERNYVEFKLAKAKTPEKVGDVQVRLTSADPKRNKYTIELIADDKRFEKKDKSANEPVQFYLSRAAQPYELVVNEVRKDMIVGYVSAPKVQQARK